MLKRGLSYADLLRRLKAMGIEDNERNLRNKVARGTFSAVFFVRCLEAIGPTTLKLDMLEFMGGPARKPDQLEDRTISPVKLAEMDRLLAEIGRRLR
jgi:hypothetical protein